eukprot:Filipodium_phascolosomae@DN5725_c0_g1_i1.p1
MRSGGSEGKERRATNADQEFKHRTQPWTLREKRMLGVLVTIGFLWVVGDGLGWVDVTTTAMVCLLASLKIVDIETLMKETAAWETLLWFGVSISFVDLLRSEGAFEYLADLFRWTLGNRVRPSARRLSFYSITIPITSSPPTPPTPPLSLSPAFRRCAS